MRRAAAAQAALILSASLLFVSGVQKEAGDYRQVQKQRQVHEQTRLFLHEEDGRVSPDFASLKEINPEFVCWLSFESGLISLPCVQHSDNSRWLTHLFDGTPGDTGTLFFDTQCEREDEVRILYGHSVFYEPSLMFTPLHTLKTEEGFFANRKFSLLYEDESEEYEIFAVAVVDERDESFPIRFRGFVTEEEHSGWLGRLKSSALIYDEDPPEDRKLLILQTCEEQESALRLCVFAYNLRA